MEESYLEAGSGTNELVDWSCSDGCYRVSNYTPI